MHKHMSAVIANDLTACNQALYGKHLVSGTAYYYIDKTVCRQRNTCNLGDKRPLVAVVRRGRLKLAGNHFVPYRIMFDAVICVTPIYASETNN